MPEYPLGDAGSRSSSHKWNEDRQWRDNSGLNILNQDGERRVEQEWSEGEPVYETHYHTEEIQEIRPVSLFFNEMPEYPLGDASSGSNSHKWQPEDRDYSDNTIVDVLPHGQEDLSLPLNLYGENDWQPEDREYSDNTMIDILPHGQKDLTLPLNLKDDDDDDDELKTLSFTNDFNQPIKL